MTMDIRRRESAPNLGRQAKEAKEEGGGLAAWRVNSSLSDDFAVLQLQEQEQEDYNYIDEYCC